MDIFGANMNGSFIVERIESLPSWGSSDVGRFLFDIKTNNYYLGAPSLEIGTDGWIPIGLVSTIVKSFNLDWDTEMEQEHGKISAINIPCKIKETIYNVNEYLNELSNNISELQKAKTIENKSVKYYHIDFETENKLMSSHIPIVNTDGYFSEETKTIESALISLQTKTAKDIPLYISEEENSTVGIFGNKLKLSADNIQNGLESLETYINNLTASNIPCYYEGSQDDSNVQFVLDALFNLHGKLKLTDLVDVQNYDSTNRFLKSLGCPENGCGGTEWTTITANEVTAKYPGETMTNVQAVISELSNSFNTLLNVFSEGKYKSENIAYTHPSFEEFDNIDNAMDYVLNNFNYPGRKINANEIPCSPIGNKDNNNIQLALNFLNTNLQQILSNGPCDIKAQDVEYISSSGHTTVEETLGYIMGFVRHMITNEGISYT